VQEQCNEAAAAERRSWQLKTLKNPFDCTILNLKSIGCSDTTKFSALRPSGAWVNTVSQSPTEEDGESYTSAFQCSRASNPTRSIGPEFGTRKLPGIHWTKIGDLRDKVSARYITPSSNFSIDQWKVNGLQVTREQTEKCLIMLKQKPNIRLIPISHRADRHTTLPTADQSTPQRTETAKRNACSRYINYDGTRGPGKPSWGKTLNINEESMAQHVPIRRG